MAFARIAVFPDGTREQYENLGGLKGEGVAIQPEVQAYERRVC